MAVLKKKIPASTLPEVVVASVIWLLFFFLTLNILVYVGTSRTDNSDLLTAEMELLTCRAEAELLGENETVVHSYEWGEIEIRKERYGEAIVRVRLKAVIGKEGKEIGYTYLVFEKNSNQPKR